VDVDYTEVTGRVRPKDHIDAIRPFLPAKYSPLTGEGNGLQSVYLAEIGEDLATLLLDLVAKAGAQPPEFVATDTQQDVESIDAIADAKQKEIESSDLDAKTKLRLVKARVGQGVLRDRLKTHETMCRITGVTNPAYLIASHTWPWRHSEPEECLDGETASS
jgi:hypothetical protein